MEKLIAKFMHNLHNDINDLYYQWDKGNVSLNDTLLSLNALTNYINTTKNDIIDKLIKEQNKTK